MLFVAVAMRVFVLLSFVIQTMLSKVPSDVLQQKTLNMLCKDSPVVHNALLVLAT